MSRQKGFSHLLVVLALGIGVFGLISSFIPINRQYNDGKSNVQGVLLAKEDDEGNSGDSGSSGSGGSNSSGSGSSESGNSSGSSGSSGLGGLNTSTSTPSKTEMKVVTPTSRVETKTTPQKIKTEIREGALRFKFEVKDGEVKTETKIKENDEDEIELQDEAEDDALDELEAELEKEDIDIATAPGQLALVNKKVGALSSFPLSVNPTTKELTVTTPSGVKVVTILPQQAVDNILASHVITDVISEKTDNNLASIPNIVKLEIKNGVLVYQVKGTKTHRLLGLIPVKTQVETFVSAENGQVMETNQSLLGRFLNRIAP